MSMQYPGMRYGSDSRYKRVGPSAEHRNIKARTQLF